jgi:FMN phosphatase YigB (HAD superfamily)
MIRVLFFDLGNTLLREADRVLFPHVIDALQTISQLKDEAGSSLKRVLASNFPAQLPVPDSKLAQVFAEVVGILRHAGLAEFFEPIDRHVTISAQAGHAKPDGEFFIKALQRLGGAQTLAECVMITEDAAHIAACRNLGMKTLQFGGHVSPPPANADFSNWLDAPMLLARLVSPHHTANVETAIRGRLEAAFPVNISSVEPSHATSTVRAHGTRLIKVTDPELGDLDGLHVEVPIHPTIQLDVAGRPIAFDGLHPSAKDIAESTSNLKSQASTGQISGVNESPLGPTLKVVVDSQGRRVVRRKGYSAF